MDSVRRWLDALKVHALNILTATHRMIQSPLGSAVVGGLVVLLIAHYGFGIG